MADVVRTVAVKFTSDTREYDRGVEKVDSSITRVKRSFGTAAIGAAGFFTAIGGVGVRAAAEFDQSMRNVQAVTGATNDELSRLSQEVLAIGRSSVAGPQAVAAAFYEISSGVTDATARIDVLKASTALAEAGQADLMTTTKGLIAAVNAYTPAILSAEEASDVYARTVAKGVGSMDEFVAALNPLAGLGASLEIDFSELGGAMAFMTSKGQSASLASTQLKAAMVAMLKPNESMKDALAAMGFESGEAAIKQLGLVGALQSMSGALGGSTDAMAMALGSTEALQAAVVLTKDEYNAFFDDYQAGLEGSTQAARRVQLESFTAQWALLKSEIQAVAIQIGQRLLPPLLSVVQGVSQAIGWLNQFGDGWMDVAVGIGAVIAAMGGITAAFGALMFIMNPLAIAFAGIALLGAGIYAAWTNDLGGLRTFVENEFGGVIAWLEEAKTKVEEFFNLLRGDTEDLGKGPDRPTLSVGIEVDVMPGDTAFGLAAASGGAFSADALLAAAGVTDGRFLQPGSYNIGGAGGGKAATFGATIGQNQYTRDSKAFDQRRKDQQANAPLSFKAAVQEAFDIDLTGPTEAFNAVADALGRMTAPDIIRGLGLLFINLNPLTGLVSLGVATEFDDISRHLGDMKDNLKGGKIGDALWDIGGALSNIPQGIAQQLFDALGADIDVDANLQAWNGVADNIGTIFSTLFGGPEVEGSIAGRALSGLMFLSTVPGMALDAIKSAFSSIAEAIWDFMVNPVVDGINTIIDAVNSLDIAGVLPDIARLEVENPFASGNAGGGGGGVPSGAQAWEELPAGASAGGGMLQTAVYGPQAAAPVQNVYIQTNEAADRVTQNLRRMGNIMP